MNIITNIAPVPSRLRVHCAQQVASRDAVLEIPTPPPTDTWMPIPHDEVIRRVEDALVQSNLTITDQAHSMTHGGLRFFGLLEVRATGRQSDDYTWVVGIRNSHDKTFPAGIVAGAQVTVCGNLSFSGEIKLSRKHTRFILRDLPQLAWQAVTKLHSKWQRQDQRIAAYKNTTIGDRDAHDLIVRSIDAGVCAASTLPKVLEEWRHPRHDTFKDRTTWSLFNAFTETLKGSLHLLPARTERLHHLMDAAVGLN